jgi:hypothetical protein
MLININGLLKLFHPQLSEEENENNQEIQDSNMVTNIYVIKRKLYNFKKKHKTIRKHKSYYTKM